MIESYASLGRPAWRLGVDPALIELYSGDLVLPRVPDYPRTATTRTGRAIAHAAHAERLRPALALALETGDPVAWAALNSDDAHQLRALRVAAARDIAGVSLEAITAAFFYTDQSTLRNRLRAGRRVLRELGAWPWCAFDGVRPPALWWQRGDGAASWLLAWWVSPRPSTIAHMHVDSSATGP